jgi:thiamine-monophosphate kinase
MQAVKVGCNLYEDKFDPQINVCENSISILRQAGKRWRRLRITFTIAMEDFEKIKGNPNFSITHT